MMWVYVNGKFVPEAEATISVFDHGFLYGDGVYEAVRIYQGKPFLFDRHLARLRRSCDLIGLVHPVDDEAWWTILTEMVRRNCLSDAGIRLTISRGPGEIGIDPGLCHQPTVVVMAKVLSPYPTEMRERGVSLKVVSVRRNPLAAQSPHIKSLSFLNNILAKQEASQAGAFDALMLNMDGYVTECTTSNVFFVRHGQVYTPSAGCGILEGITREVIIELARTLGVSVKEGYYEVDAFLGADECFITNTGMEVMSVSRIDQNVIGTGKSGPLAHQLWKAFQDNLGRYLGPSLLETPG